MYKNTHTHTKLMVELTALSKKLEKKESDKKGKGNLKEKEETKEK